MGCPEANALKTICSIFDLQSGDITHSIRSYNITHSLLSVDGGKVLVAGWKGDMGYNHENAYACAEYRL
jgi:hypothetical protein